LHVVAAKDEKITMIMLSMFATALITMLALMALRPVACRMGLLDMPDHRKLHDGAIPLIGGIAVFIGICVSFMLFIPLDKSIISYLCAALLIVGVGAMDDLKDLPVHLRLLLQLTVTVILCSGTGLYLENLGDLIGFGDVHLGLLGYVCTTLAIMGAINAFNMMDGIDGLAGTMALIAYAALAFLFQRSGDQAAFQLALIFSVALIPYLMMNLTVPPFKKKIFMGDAGSMLNGLSIVWLLIHGSQGEVQSFEPVTAVWLVAIPLMDMVAIMIRRVKKRQSPFKPDRDHLHHIFMRARFSDRESLVFIVMMGVLLAAIGILGDVLAVSESVRTLGFVGVFLIYCYALKHAWLLTRFFRKHPLHPEELV